MSDEIQVQQLLVTVTLLTFYNMLHVTSESLIYVEYTSELTRNHLDAPRHFASNFNQVVLTAFALYAAAQNVP